MKKDDVPTFLHSYARVPEALTIFCYYDVLSRKNPWKLMKNLDQLMIPTIPLRPKANPPGRSRHWWNWSREFLDHCLCHSVGNFIIPTDYYPVVRGGSDLELWVFIFLFFRRRDAELPTVSQPHVRLSTERLWYASELKPPTRIFYVYESTSFESFSFKFIHSLIG